MVEINVVYTKTGDDGTTSLASDQRVSKCGARIEALGSIDETNSSLGVAFGMLSDIGGFPGLCKQILRIQNELFNLGAELAVDTDEPSPQCPCIKAENVTQLESEIDSRNQTLPALSSFILPSGNTPCAQLHVCRTVCRRAERRLVALAEQESVRDIALPYLNRLSDWLFVMARWVLKEQHITEKFWQP